MNVDFQQLSLQHDVPVVRQITECEMQMLISTTMLSANRVVTATDFQQ